MTDNEIIAEFMGGVFNQDEDYPNKWIFKIQPNHFHRSDAKHLTIGLLYDTSWDWLMPVVEKIGNMYRIDFGNQHEITRLHSLSLFAGKEKVYQAVVEFIKWYNENKENN